MGARSNRFALMKSFVGVLSGNDRSDQHVLRTTSLDPRYSLADAPAEE